MKKLLVLVVAVVAAIAFGAAHASASSAPTVITYAKTCTAAGHCEGTAGNGGTITMDVTGFRATGDAAQLTMSERVTVDGFWFTAVLSGHSSPAGFIVLNGVVTDSSDASFVGAQVHQRSDLVGVVGTSTAWTGQVQLMSASA
jgi:hypothetical protein